MHSDPVKLTRLAGSHLHRFHGGLRLRHNKKISCHDPVTRPGLPELLTVPLQQHSGAPAKAIVKKGDSVLKGDAVGQCDAGQRDVIHAPTSGTILSIENRGMSHVSGLPGPCIVIKPDGDDKWCELSPCRDWEKESTEALNEAIRRAGIAGLGGAVYPTHAKAESGKNAGIHTLILNGAECEPYISCDEMLMREQPDQIVLGARILQKILGAERTVIAIEDQMGAVHRALKAAIDRSNDPNFLLVKIPSIYPEGGERQLIQVLTDQEVPAGGLPSDIGVICQNVGTAAAVAAAVREGKPLIERYVTVSGNGVVHPRNHLALLGTPIRHLINLSGGYTPDAARIVIGGPMMGFSLPSDEEPVVKACNCVLVMTQQDIQPPQAEMPCIRCGECARVCPAQLLPQQLHWQIRNGQWEDAQADSLASCIECGCCDFVCPSHIPLVDWFRHGKSEINKLNADRVLAIHAKDRFEARDARLLKMKQERRERIAKRKQALSSGAEQRDKVAAAIERAGKKRSSAATEAGPEHTDSGEDGTE